MAYKFALLAALCVAQAFAFPPLAEDLDDVTTRAVTSKDLRIVLDCFALQGHIIGAMNEKLVALPQVIVDGVRSDIKEAVAEALKQTEKPVAQITVALTDTHRDMHKFLSRLDVIHAYGALINGVRTIEGLENGIRTELNKVKVEHPELADAMDWYMRYLSFQMGVYVPKMRRDFGECLFIGRPSNEV